MGDGVKRFCDRKMDAKKRIADEFSVSGAAAMKWDLGQRNKFQTEVGMDSNQQPTAMSPLL